MTSNEYLKQIEQILKDALKGKQVTDLPNVDELPEDLKEIGELFNTFIHNINESKEFVRQLSSGNLSAETPSRKNHVAGPLKEIHSQLISMSVNIKDLTEGKIVSKLYYPGELFENYNKLIDMTGRLLKDNCNDGPSSISSWKYHQVLSAINQLSTMIVQYDNTGKLVFANVAAKKKLMGIEQLPENKISEKDNLISYLGQFTPIIQEMKPHEAFGKKFPVKKELYDKGSDTWYSINTDISNQSDGTTGVLHMIDDISEWKYNEQELKNEASLDPLTSAYTRKFGDKKFQELINKRSSSCNCVAFVDMDGLKHINDTYGHTEGDFAIKTVATVLMSNVRDTDWVVRYGGDEFLILFKDCNEEVAKKIISRMYEQLDDLNSSFNKPYEIQFSVGLVQIEKDMDDIQSIVNLVDEKMYDNKLARKSK